MGLHSSRHGREHAAASIEAESRRYLQVRAVEGGLGDEVAETLPSTLAASPAVALHVVLGRLKLMCVHSVCAVNDVERVRVSCEGGVHLWRTVRCANGWWLNAGTHLQESSHNLSLALVKPFEICERESGQPRTIRILQVTTPRSGPCRARRTHLKGCCRQ